MYQPPTSATGMIAEAAIPLQTAESGVPIWIVVLGTCSVLLGVSIVVRRRTRSPPDPPVSTSRPSFPTPEAPVLTDEERVVGLLESNGGRMRQTRIVERTDWSKSKVSMLLSDMEDDGAVHKLRVGRENIVSLPGYEPTVSRPPNEHER